MAPAPLAFWEGGWVFLQYLQDKPPIFPVKVELEDVPSMGRPQEIWERVLALGGANQKYDIGNVVQVFCMNDRQPVPVNLWLRPVHPTPMRCHITRSDIHPMLWIWYPPY